MPDQTYNDRPTWGVDPQSGGPGPLGGATGAGGGYNYGSFTFDPAVQAALDAIKGGKSRAQTTLEQLFDRGYLQNGQNIDANWISQLMGQGWGGGVDQFWGRVNRYMTDGSLPGGGGGGGAGGGGGSPIPENLQAGGGGGSMPGQYVNNNPFGGQLGGYIQDIINKLQGQHGYDEEILNSWFAQAREGAALRERDRITRRGDDYAAKGLFGGGQQTRDIERIEQQEGQNLQQANNEINLENARAAQAQVNQLLQALGMATGREMGLGQLDLGYGNLGLGYDQLALSGELGRGNLQLGQADLALQSAIQEWLMMMQLNQNWM